MFALDVTLMNTVCGRTILSERIILYQRFHMSVTSRMKMRVTSGRLLMAPKAVNGGLVQQQTTEAKMDFIYLPMEVTVHTDIIMSMFMHTVK